MTFPASLPTSEIAPPMEAPSLALGHPRYRLDRRAVHRLRPSPTRGRRSPPSARAARTGRSPSRPSGRSRTPSGSFEDTPPDRMPWTTGARSCARRSARSPSGAANCLQDNLGSRHGGCMTFFVARRRASPDRLTGETAAITLTPTREVRMSQTRRLTGELVRLATREVADAGRFRFRPFQRSGLRRAPRRVPQDRPEGPLHVFAYGSLIWKPVYEPAAAQRATAPGWHRAFCLKVARFRGTIDRPGLMMQLHPGDGVAEASCTSSIGRARSPTCAPSGVAR